MQQSYRSHMKRFVQRISLWHKCKLPAENCSLTFSFIPRLQNYCPFNIRMCHKLTHFSDLDNFLQVRSSSIENFLMAIEDLCISFPPRYTTSLLKLNYTPRQRKCSTKNMFITFAFFFFVHNTPVRGEMD